MKRTLKLVQAFLLFGLAGSIIAQSANTDTSIQPELKTLSTVRTISTLGGSPKQCAFATQPLLEELRSMAYPADWSFLVVCTDAEWDTVLRMADIRATDTAFTVLPKRTTVLRAAIFIRTFERGYKNTLLHELGHVQCNCMSEDKANAYAHANGRNSRR
jgi:hypothetical protein